MPPKTPRKRAGGELHEGPALDENTQRAGVAEEGGRALGVGEQDAEAAHLQVRDEPPHQVARAGERALEQHAAAVAERDRGELAVAQVERAVGRELPARGDLERDPLVGQRSAQVVGPGGEGAGRHAVREADVRRGGHDARAVPHGGIRERERGGQVGRAVVDAGQQVRVQVDHRARNTLSFHVDLAPVRGFPLPGAHSSTSSRSAVTMARGDVRIAVTLACEECKRRNYQTNKSKRNNPDRITLRKYCKWCRRHTGHRETR